MIDTRTLSTDHSIGKLTIQIRCTGYISLLVDRKVYIPTYLHKIIRCAVRKLESIGVYKITCHFSKFILTDTDDTPDILFLRLLWVTLFHLKMPNRILHEQWRTLLAKPLEETRQRNFFEETELVHSLQFPPIVCIFSTNIYNYYSARLRKHCNNKRASVPPGPQLIMFTDKSPITPA